MHSFFKIIIFTTPTVYSEDPRPEYAPKKNKTNKPPAARPPIVATIQSGTRPASLILTISLKYYLNNETILICLICLVKEIT